MCMIAVPRNIARNGEKMAVKPSRLTPPTGNFLTTKGEKP
jgi:hypothetical protein